MKDYKRLTERDEFGNADIIGVDSRELTYNLDFDGALNLTFALNRLAKLEDKIESGEIDYVADRDEKIKAFESENAELRATLSKMETVEKELRERLDKAVELPCKVGDTVYLIRQAILKKPYKLEIEETKIEKVILTKTGWKVKFESNSFYETSIKNFNKTWFTDKSEAEARLAELKGGRE